MRAKLKDLDVLAEGMRRAKNIKEESRYYFMQAVLQHNCKAYSESIKSLQKFLKIVLFIRDEKSVQLALNAIGTEYMYLGEFQSNSFLIQKQQNIIKNKESSVRELISFQATSTAVFAAKQKVISNQRQLNIKPQLRFLRQIKKQIENSQRQG